MKILLTLLTSLYFIFSIHSNNTQVDEAFWMEHHPEYNLAITEGKMKKKPILLLFSGTTCRNLMKTDSIMRSSNQIQKLLKEDFVFKYLLVDDSRKLSKKEKYISHQNREIKNVGNRNADLQITKFKCNSQPFFVVLNAQGKELERSRFMASTDELLSWLKKGHSKYYNE